MIRRIIRWLYRKFIAGSIDIPPLPSRDDVLNTQIQQRQLQARYQSLLAQNLPLPKLADTGFRVFSQRDEDGILHYIFSLIGITSKVCLEIAYAVPEGANTTSLILNNGWNGILVCAKETEVESVRKFFRSHPDTNPYCPELHQYWVTTENLNEIAARGMNGPQLQDNEIDLFSLDVDGVDYLDMEGTHHRKSESGSRRVPPGAWGEVSHRTLQTRLQPL